MPLTQTPDATVRLSHPTGRYVLLDDEAVVFDPLSWEVHVLNPAASAIYEFLAEQPRAMSEVTALLAELLVDAEKDAAAVHAERTIDDLARLGLVSAG